MSYIIIPTKRTRQPQGAVRLLPEFQRSVVDVGFQQRSVLDGVPWATFGTAPTYDAGRYGLRTNQLAAFGGLVRTGLSAAPASQVLLFSGYVTTRTGAYAGILARASSDGSATSISIQREGADSNWRMYHTNSSEMPNGVINPDEDFTLVISALGGSIYTYVNGQPWGPTITASGATQSNSRIVTFGERSASASYATKGVCYVRGAWNTGWPPELARQVSTNPWQIFASEPTRIYFGAGGGTTTTDAAIAVTETLDSAAIAATVTTGAAIAATDTLDSAALTGAIWRASQIAVTDTLDAASVAATVTTGAAIAATDTLDAASLTGDINVGLTSASISGTETADSTAATTAVTTGAALVALDAADSIIVTAAVTTPASISVTETLDSAGITGAASGSPSIWTDIGVTSASWSDVGGATSIWTDL